MPTSPPSSSDRTEWKALLQRGIESVRRQQGRQALSLLQRALSLNPTDRDTRYWLANAMRLSQQHAESESLFLGLLA